MKTADRLGYKAGDLNSEIDLINVNLCKLSGRRATSGCQHAGTAYSDRVPAESAPPLNDLCPIHPAKAEAVNQRDLDQNPAPFDSRDQFPPPARRAPSQPQRALPVDPTPPRAEPVEDIPLRAIPVE
jgi:hypothetical protein